nr:PP2C family protein-serine/threonine phosphatase [Sphaerisporangium rubeum]
MLAGLLEASHLAGLEQVPWLARRHAAEIGVLDVRIYLADLQQDVLRLLVVDGYGDELLRTSEIRIDKTPVGEAFQEIRIFDQPDADGTRHQWWVPLLDGTERLGMALIVTPDAAGPTVDDMKALASLMALMIVSKRPSSDAYARLVRTRPMHVGAEMQWNLMPPLTFAAERVAISAALEPAYEIGGDAFDYALTGSHAHLAIFDAMGHDVSAGLTASLATAACRNNRRQGTDLVETSEAIERILIEQFGRGTRFVTAILARLNLVTGVLSWVNRGHPPPVVIRGEHKIIGLRCRPAHPMGLDMGLPITLCHERLEPGDRVLFYTDGITEARDPKGREFGLDRFVEFIVRHNADHLPVPETLRRLIHNLMAHHGGNLQDDATVLLTEWLGPAPSRLSV